jgi:hypothetical protein
MTKPRWQRNPTRRRGPDPPSHPMARISLLTSRVLTRVYQPRVYRSTHNGAGPGPDHSGHPAASTPDCTWEAAARPRPPRASSPAGSEQPGRRPRDQRQVAGKAACTVRPWATWPDSTSRSATTSRAMWATWATWSHWGCCTRATVQPRRSWSRCHARMASRVGRYSLPRRPRMAPAFASRVSACATTGRNRGQPAPPRRQRHRRRWARWASWTWTAPAARAQRAIRTAWSQGTRMRA